MGFLSDAGYDLPSDDNSVAAPTGKSFFESYGFQMPQAPKKEPAKLFSDEIPIPVPGQPGYGPPNPDALEHEIATSLNPINVAKTAGSAWWNATKEAALSGYNQYQSGLTDIGQSMTARGAGNIGLGILGMVGSPLSGVTGAIGQGVTQLTGNPEIGERAATLSGLMLPVKGGSVAAKAATQDRAMNTIVNTIGPENVPGLVAELRSNPRLALIDKSDPLRTMAQGLIDPAQPAAQDAITQNIKQRMATLPAATNSVFTEAMGPTPNVPAMLDSLKQRAKDVGLKMIQPAISDAGPVDITDTINSLDKTIGPYALKALQAGETPKLPMTSAQQTAWDLRQRLRGNLPDRDTMFMDPAQAHEIQSQMRYEGSQLASSSVGSERLLSPQIMGIRNQLVDAIDDAANGAYKPALSKYRDAMMVQEAFEKGFDTLKNRSGVNGLEDRPDMFQKWVDNASPEEIVARRLGTRLDIDQKLNGVKNSALAGQNVVAPEYNKQKLSSLFGEQESNRLIQAMQDTATEANTNAKILANSKTAETLAGQKALEVRQLGGGNPSWILGPAAEVAGTYLTGEPGLGTAAYLTAKGAQLGTQFGLRALDRSRNLAFAKAVSATGAEREPVLQTLLSHPAVLRAMQKTGGALTTP